MNMTGRSQSQDSFKNSSLKKKNTFRKSIGEGGGGLFRKMSMRMGSIILNKTLSVSSLNKSGESEADGSE